MRPLLAATATGQKKHVERAGQRAQRLAALRLGRTVNRDDRKARLSRRMRAAGRSVSVT
jgi:hypothetical protein